MQLRFNISHSDEHVNNGLAFIIVGKSVEIMKTIRRI